MGPEAKLYKKIKRSWKQFSFTRLENLVSLGCPDCLVYNNNGHFFTLELKVTKGKKIRFSPHQIAFHKRHPDNTFILVQGLGPRCLKLFRGSRIQDLVACGLELDACCLGLDACGLFLEQLGAWTKQCPCLPSSTRGNGSIKLIRSLYFELAYISSRYSSKPRLSSKGYLQVSPHQ